MSAGADTDAAPGASGGPPLVLHASCVTGPSGAVLIRGASGAGKSALALALLGLGGALVADDRIELRASKGVLHATAPESIAGMIEARGLGLLHVAHRRAGTVRWVVDMDRASAARLPRLETCDILDVTLPLLAGRDMAHLPSMLWLLMNGATLHDPERKA